MWPFKRNIKKEIRNLQLELLILKRESDLLEKCIANAAHRYDVERYIEIAKKIVKVRFRLEELEENGFITN